MGRIYLKLNNIIDIFWQFIKEKDDGQHMIINSHDIALDISLIHSKLCWSVERSELNGALSKEYLKARNSMIE